MRRLSLGKFSTSIGVDTEARLRAIEVALGEVELASHVGSVGDLPTTLTDPNADLPLFWSDKKKEFKFLKSGTGVKVDTDDDGEGSIRLDLAAGDGIDIAGNEISVEPRLQAINILPFAADKLIRITAGSPPTADLIDFSMGMYLPTLTFVANVSAATPDQTMYMRIGPLVGVFGHMNIDPAAIGEVSLRISIPIPSTFGNLRDCIGTGSSKTHGAGQIEADPSPSVHEAVLSFRKLTGSDLAAGDCSFIFWYRILPWPPP